MSHAVKFLEEACKTAGHIEPQTIEALCDELTRQRDRRAACSPSALAAAPAIAAMRSKHDLSFVPSIVQ